MVESNMTQVLIDLIEEVRVEHGISMSLLCTQAHMAKKTYIALKRA